MQISMTEYEKSKLQEIRQLANNLAQNHSSDKVYSLAGLIAELAKSFSYCDAGYVREKLNLIFYEEQVKWHTDR